MLEVGEVFTVKIDNCARGEGVSGTAACLKDDSGRLNVGYFTDNEVVVLVFDRNTEIIDIDPVDVSVSVMCVGTAYDVGLQLKHNGVSGVYFYDENSTCLGSIHGDFIEPEEYYVWDLTEDCPEEIDERIVKELGL